jgi:hypothetical protein
VFAWSVYDAPGVSSKLAFHALNSGLEHKLVSQKRQKLALEKATIVLEKVERLLASRAIREVQYLVWLSNTVVVKKKNGKWRVCIDFTNLNKACPKDPFPLSRIDLPGCFSRLSSDPNECGRPGENNFYHTKRGVLLYNDAVWFEECRGNLPENGHQDVRAHIRKTVEVYIYDMLIKSLRKEDHTTDLLQVFDILRRSRLCLNASKCTFGVSSGKFLGHVVSRREIEANPDQIAALVDLAEPRNIKQVQRLTGMVAALRCFISRSADK